MRTEVELLRDLHFAVYQWAVNGRSLSEEERVDEALRQLEIFYKRKEIQNVKTR